MITKATRNIIVAYFIGDRTETNHIERWFNTLRQRLARFVRKNPVFF